MTIKIKCLIFCLAVLIEKMCIIYLVNICSYWYIAAFKLICKRIVPLKFSHNFIIFTENSTDRFLNFDSAIFTSTLRNYYNILSLFSASEISTTLMWNNLLRKLWNRKLSFSVKLNTPLTFAVQIFHCKAISLCTAKFHTPYKRI